MATLYSPRIATDGMVLCLDAGNSKSYPGTGTVFTDLSGNSNTGTVYNGAAYSSASNGGIFTFDGSNDYVGVGSPNSRFSWTVSGAGLNYMSIEMWVKSSDTSGRTFSKPWNGNGEYNYWVDNSGWGVNSGGSSYALSCTSYATGNWEHFVYIATPLQLLVYRRGILNAGPTNHGLTGNIPTYGNANIDLAIMTLYPYGSGTWSYTGHGIAGDLGLFRIYNRILSSSEIIQNYNAQKGRYGLS